MPWAKGTARQSLSLSAAILIGSENPSNDIPSIFGGNQKFSFETNIKEIRAQKVSRYCCALHRAIN
jgi:hypothetical protein